MTRPHDVVLYSRKRCHLCDVVKRVLERVAPEEGVCWREVDIDSDPELRRRFTDKVPVVFIDGEQAFQYTLDENEFRQRVR